MTAAGGDAAALLAARCAALPEVLAEVLDSAGDAEARPDLRLAAALPLERRFLVTGIGASEGPARFLAQLLAEQLGLRARFVPLSAFVVGEAPAGGRDSVRIVFSQGLSPNARLALREPAACGAALLYTSVAPDDAAADDTAKALAASWQRQGGVVAVLPPRHEGGLLLRVLGPAAAMLAAAQFAAVLAGRCGQALPGSLAELPAAVRSAAARAAAAFAAFDGCAEGPAGPALLAALLAEKTPLALITSGGYGEYCHGLRWKLLEGAGCADPPLWDALQVVHGPFQQHFREPLLLCALPRADSPSDAALLHRLESLLPRGRHHLLRLEAQLPGPLAIFDHDAQCNALLQLALRHRDWDLMRWPGQNQDGALYDVSAPAQLYGRLR